MDRKVILLELNEVPYKIYDYYCEQRPDSTLARTRSRCREYETVAPEEGEQLQPWCTWPTFHRGVDANTHGILRIGQDLRGINEKYASVWSLLANAGVKTGVFGPFASHPLPADHEKYAFYVPEVFASDEDCWPESLKPFQRFNLRMTSESGRNVSQSIDLKSAVGFLASAPFQGLRLRTIGKLVNQLMDERKEPWKSCRRRTYQPVMAFDLFMKQVERTRPQFCNFHSNHVASSMHRYWAAAFPDEFDDNQYGDEWRRRYAAEIFFTMGVVDDLLARLIEFAEANPEYLLLIASCMGQAAASGEPILSQATVTDMDLFMKVAGFSPQEYQRRPAMEPNQGVLVAPERQAELVAFLKSLSSLGKSPTPIEKAEGYVAWATPGLNVSPDEEVMLVGGAEMSFKDLGITNEIIEDGTGLNGDHVAEGSLLIYDPTRVFERNSEPHRVSTLDVAPFLLDLFDVPAPGYMRPATAISIA